MEKKEIIISGPEYYGEEFLGSVAEYIIPKMKAQPKDCIIQVDHKTNESITSYDFLKGSLEVTEGLREFGLKNGDVVVLLSPNSIRCHMTAMGILFSGGILAALDQNLKPLELQHFFSQFQPKYIICETQKAKDIQKSITSVKLKSKIILLDSLKKQDEDLYCWNDIRTKVDVSTYIPRKVSNPKADVVLISCSSGSTGLPKGVALSHFCVLFNNSTLLNMSVYHWDQNILMLSPLFWISGIIYLTMGCIMGITRFVPKSNRPEDILEAIQKYKPFYFFTSPANLLILMQHPDFKKYNLEGLKAIYTGGSVLSEFIAQKVKEAWPEIEFYQSYGLTELSGPITCTAKNENILSIGKLLPEIKVKVVDATTGQTLGPNKIGELRVKTKRIMVGYYNNEKATKATFDEDGWLLTGDLVYFDDDEILFVVGRIKEAIKVRNYQISPTEIESFLISLPGVKDAGVVPIPHERDSYHLKALVVKAPKSNITADDIIQSVKTNLSESKQLQEGVQFVDEIPRSETGKLKRGELNKLGLTL